MDVAILTQDEKNEQLLNAAESATYNGHTTVMAKLISEVSNKEGANQLGNTARRVIFMVKIDTVNIFMGFFSGEKTKIQVDLMNPILAFIFPSWLRSRKELQIKEIPTLKRRNIPLLKRQCL